MNSVTKPYGNRKTATALAAVLVVATPAAAGQRGASPRHGARPSTELGYAIISPGRVLIGKNVRVEGVVGTRYGIVPAELDDAAGDPLTMDGDFRGLDQALDVRLEELYGVIVIYDVNGDNRLRVDHPVEGAGLVGHPALVDYDGNGDVDDFDLFLARYDANGDGGVTYPRAFGVSLAREFRGIDDQLAALIDEARPDRNGDGEITIADRALGYKDGVLDGRDAYAKVHGQLAFAVERADWEATHGESYQTVVQGPIRPEVWESAVGFGVSEEELPEVTPVLLDDSLSWFKAQVPPHAGQPPADPADLAIGAHVLEAGTFTPAALCDWESVPFGSDGAYDYYQRPLYEDFTFKNMRIPQGNNGLFRNCTFVGVTFVESESRCTHQDWNYAGAVEPIPDGGGGFTYELRFPDLPPPPPDHIGIDGVEVRDTKPYSNNLRFEGCAFLGSVGASRLQEHTHWRNMIQLTGVTRSFLHVDEVDPPTLTDAAGVPYIDYLALLTDEERDELGKSSLLLPTWAVRIRNFDTQDGETIPAPVMRLRGFIVTGTLDAHGTLDIHGTVASTFRAEEGSGPLFYGGHPSDFTTSLGVFEPDQHGEFPGFGAITVRYDPEIGLPDGKP